MAEKSAKSKVESVVAEEENTLATSLATRERNLSSCVERLHRCSWSKQAPNDNEQKEIDESQFDEEDKHHRRVSDVTEEP